MNGTYRGAEANFFPFVAAAATAVSRTFSFLCTVLSGAFYLGSVVHQKHLLSGLCPDMLESCLLRRQFPPPLHISLPSLNPCLSSPSSKSSCKVWGAL